MASHAGIHTVSSMIYALHISLLTAGTHKNQLHCNLNTISCRLSTYSYNIYFFLFKNFSSICPFLSLYFSKWSGRCFTSHFHSFFDNWRTYTIMDTGSWWRAPCSWYVRRLDFIAHRAAEDVAGKGIGSGDGRYGPTIAKRDLFYFHIKTDILIARYWSLIS